MPRKPYKWSPNILKQTEEYLLSVLRPSILGLARELGVSRETIYCWSRTYPAFAELVAVLGGMNNHSGGIHFWKQSLTGQCGGDNLTL
jgi:hypothetical protein